MKTYVYTVELQQKDDGRWSSWIPALPGCASWGTTKEEAIENIHDALQVYAETLEESGRSLPTDKQTLALDYSAVSIAL